MPPTKDKPVFPAVLRHLPMPHPLGQHDRREDDSRRRLTGLLQDTQLTTVQMDPEELHALLTRTEDEPPRPTAWPRPNPLYIEARQPVMLRRFRN